MFGFGTKAAVDLVVSRLALLRDGLDVLRIDARFQQSALRRRAAGANVVANIPAAGRHGGNHDSVDVLAAVERQGDVLAFLEDRDGRLRERLLLLHRRQRRLEFIDGDRVGNLAEDSAAEVPGERIQVIGLRLLGGVISNKGLVLIEDFGIDLVLIDDKDLRRQQVRADEHVDMVLVGAGGAEDAAVSRRHRNAPLLAVGFLVGAVLSLGRLDGNRQPLPLELPGAVIFRFLLRRRRVGVGVLLGLLDGLDQRVMVGHQLVDRGEVADPAFRVETVQVNVAGLEVLDLQFVGHVRRLLAQRVDDEAGGVLE